VLDWVKVKLVGPFRLRLILMTPGNNLIFLSMLELSGGTNGGGRARRLASQQIIFLTLRIIYIKNWAPIKKFL